MNPRKKCIATDALLLVASLFACAAIAAPAGTVVQANGPLFTQAADGRIKALSADSTVATGDTLVSGRETFAQVRFTDGGVVTLGPDTRISIDAYRFEPSNPAVDRSQLTLTQGSLQVLPGELAGRSPDRQVLSTPAGDIKSGASSFVIRYVGEASGVAAAEPIRLASLSLTLSDAPLLIAQLPAPPAGAGLAAGLYVHVIDGIINLNNKGGSMSFTAGQFGYTASFKQPPVVIPQNPGMQFTPPPSFTASTAGTQASGTSGKSNTVDCEVR